MARLWKRFLFLQCQIIQTEKITAAKTVSFIWGDHPKTAEERIPWIDEQSKDLFSSCCFQFQIFTEKGHQKKRWSLVSKFCSQRLQTETILQPLSQSFICSFCRRTSKQQNKNNHNLKLIPQLLKTFNNVGQHTSEQENITWSKEDMLAEIDDQTASWSLTELNYNLKVFLFSFH